MVLHKTQGMNTYSSFAERTDLVESLIASAMAVQPTINEVAVTKTLNEVVDTMIYRSSCGYKDNILFNTKGVMDENLMLVGADMAKAIKRGARVQDTDRGMVITILMQAAQMAIAISPFTK